MRALVQGPVLASRLTPEKRTAYSDERYDRKAAVETKSDLPGGAHAFGCQLQTERSALGEASGG